MSTAELQQQLEERGIEYEGFTKLELQDALWARIQEEAGLLPLEDTQVSLAAILAPYSLHHQSLAQLLPRHQPGRVLGCT